MYKQLGKGKFTQHRQSVNIMQHIRILRVLMLYSGDASYGKELQLGRMFQLERAYRVDLSAYKMLNHIHHQQL